MKKTAAILLAVLTVAGPVQAMTVSAKVGPLLKEAQALIADKNYKAAVAKLDEAEAARSNPDDEIVIAQMRQFIAVKSSDSTQPHCTSAEMGFTKCDGRPVTGAQP